MYIYFKKNCNKNGRNLRNHSMQLIIIPELSFCKIALAVLVKNVRHILQQLQEANVKEMFQ